MKGVPTMRATPAVPAPPIVARPVPAAAGRTVLDEVGRLRIRVATPRDAWRRGLASSATSPERRGWLGLWLAEADLAREYPGTAIERIDALLRAHPTSRVRALAVHDRAEALFYSGRYADARHAFEAELRGKAGGFPRKEAALWVRHARACQGYHEDNERLGVPLPLRLDPLCGASAIAVCLRALGLPHERASMARVVRHTGEGSSLEDLQNACDRLGVAANPVRATDKGLRALPLPAVAFVEGDHFVAVVDADAKGVEYVCSDCGAWPGGPVRVGWKAWRAMNPGAYLTVVRRGSPEAAAMDRVAPREAAPAPAEPKTVVDAARSLMDVALGVTQVGLTGAASRIAARLVGSVATLQLSPSYVCQYRPSSLHCPEGFGPCCPWDDASSGMNHGGPKDGDPINLATGELEDRPAPDLTVYNPIGPSVSWSRTYNSLSSVECGLGTGWSHPYNFVMTTSFGMEARERAFLIFPNGAQIQFIAPVPTTTNPPPSHDHPILNYISPPGVPITVAAYYDSTPQGRHYIVTFADRSRWTMIPPYAIGGAVITQMTDRVGNALNFSSATTAPPARTSG